MKMNDKALAMLRDKYNSQSFKNMAPASPGSGMPPAGHGMPGEGAMPPDESDPMADHMAQAAADPSMDSMSTVNNAGSGGYDDGTGTHGEGDEMHHPAVGEAAPVPKMSSDEMKMKMGRTPTPMGKVGKVPVSVGIMVGRPNMAGKSGHPPSFPGEKGIGKKKG